MKLDNNGRVLNDDDDDLHFPLRSSISLGVKELYKPTLSYRLGLLWLVLDPFFTTAIYGALFIIVRGQFQAWSVLVGLLTLTSLNNPISSNVSQKLAIEPFPLVHTPTSTILISRFVTGGLQGILVGFSGSVAIFAFSEPPLIMFVELPLVCLVLSFIGVSIGLLVAPIVTIIKDLDKLVKYVILLSFFLQAVLYDYSMTSGTHKTVLSYMPHTLGVEWLRSEFSGGEYPFDANHIFSVTIIWLLICVYSVSRINRARWRLTIWG